MQKQHIAFSFGTDYAVNICSLLDHTSHTLIFSASLRLYMAVRIIHMKDCQILRR
jgi:hypothetical protein